MGAVLAKGLGLLLSGAIAATGAHLAGKVLVPYIYEKLGAAEPSQDQ
jgi:hypothetical protein